MIVTESGKPVSGAMVSLVESRAQTAKIHTKVIWCKFSVDYTVYLVLVQILERCKMCSNVHPKETCGKGTASFPVPGNAKYDVMITKDGYEDYYKKLVSSLIWISVSRNYFQDVFCNLGVPCSDCKPMLEVNLVEVTSTIIINIINKLTATTTPYINIYFFLLDFTFNLKSWVVIIPVIS